MIKFTFLCSLQKLVLKTSADCSEVIDISCQLSQVIILQYMHPTDYYYQLVTFSIALTCGAIGRDAGIVTSQPFDIIRIISMYTKSTIQLQA